MLRRIVMFKKSVILKDDMVPGELVSYSNSWGATLWMTKKLLLEFRSYGEESEVQKPDGPL
jgi:hypothetical protein